MRDEGDEAEEEEAGEAAGADSTGAAAWETVAVRAGAASTVVETEGGAEEGEGGREDEPARGDRAVATLVAMVMRPDRRLGMVMIG